MIDGLAIRSQLPQIEVAAADREIALVMRVLEPPGEAGAHDHDGVPRLHGGGRSLALPEQHGLGHNLPIDID